MAASSTKASKEDIIRLLLFLRQPLFISLSELRSCVKVEVDVLGSRP